MSAGVQIEKQAGGVAVIHMEGRPLCMVAAKDAAELDELMMTIAALPLSTGRALAVANAMLAAFAMGIVAGQSALMFDDRIDITGAEGAAP